MAQHKWVKAANGTGIDGVVGSADATSITTDKVWVIAASGLTRDELYAALEDVQNKILATSTTFPAA